MVRYLQQPINVEHAFWALSNDSLTTFSAELSLWLRQERVASGGIMLWGCPFIHPAFHVTIHSSCYQTREHDILKKNVLISIQLGKVVYVARAWNDQLLGSGG